MPIIRKANSLAHLLMFLVSTWMFALTAPAQAQPIQPQAPRLSGALLRPAVPVVDQIGVTSKCGADVQSVDVTFEARIVAPRPSAEGSGKALVYIWINGREIQAATGDLYSLPDMPGNPNTGIAFKFDNSFRGLGGKANVQFALSKTGPKSSAKMVSYACAELRGRAPIAAGVVALPNLKVLPMVAIAYRPPREEENPNRGFTLMERRVSLGTPIVALVEQDLSRTMPAFRIMQSVCPANGDASVTLTFAIAVEAKGTNLEGYVGEGYFQSHYPYGGSPIFLPGGRVMDSRPGRRPIISNLPVGYEWASFDRVVPCSKASVIEYKVDPDNKLNEADESDNVIRFRIATMPP